MSLQTKVYNSKLKEIMRSIVYSDTKVTTKFLSSTTYLPLRIVRGLFYEIAQRMVTKDVTHAEQLGMLIRWLKLGNVMLLGVLPDGNKVALRFEDFPSIGALIDIYDHEIYEKHYALERGDVVFDVGSNLGYFTLKAAKRVGYEGLVISAEPDPHNFRALLRNICVNGYKRVLPVNAALCNTDGEIEFFACKYCGGISSMFKGKMSERLQVRAYEFDTLVKRLDIHRVDLVKVDVEGAEVEVIKGTYEALKKRIVKNLVIAAYHVPKNIRLTIVETLKDANYRVFLTKDGYIYASSNINVSLHKL